MKPPETSSPASFEASITRRELAVELLEVDWQRRIFDPVTDPDAEHRLAELRAQWAESQTTVVFTSGAYDLLHTDHCAYLLDTKLQGASRHYTRFYERGYGEPWEDLSEPLRETLIEEFLRLGELKLVVSVDGNAKVDAGKSRRPEKGGGQRPILDWQTRARLLATLSIEAPGGQRQPVADVVTANDPVTLADTHHRDLFAQAAWLRPDVWAAYHESGYIFEEMSDHDQLRGIEVRRITATNRFTDALIGNFSSTAILKRMKG